MRATWIHFSLAVSVLLKQWSVGTGFTYPWFCKEPESRDKRMHLSSVFIIMNFFRSASCLSTAPAVHLLGYADNLRRRLNTVNTKARHWTRSWDSFIHLLSSEPEIRLNVILISFSVFQVYQMHLKTLMYLIYLYSCFSKIYFSFALKSLLRFSVRYRTGASVQVSETDRTPNFETIAPKSILHDKVWFV